MLLRTFQSELNEWYLRHSDQSLKVVKKIATLRNKLTYATAIRVDNAIGSDSWIKSSGVSSLILEEIFENCNELKRIQQKMLVNVGNIKRIVVSLRDDDDDGDDECDIDIDILECVSLQIEKQTFLEMSIHESLSNLGDFSRRLPSVTCNSNSVEIDTMNYVGNVSSLDSDCMTTMITCFVYSPYLKTNDLKHIMTLKIDD